MVKHKEVSIVIPTYNEKENIQIKKDLDANFESVFRCPFRGDSSVIYRY